MFYGKIKGIRYNPSFRMPKLHEYSNLEEGIKKSSSFIFLLGKDRFAVSWWVSPKRTRSYPYARVYNTLQFNQGKRVTIIPVMKDEGKDGDRDFIQWDTISLMSLLGVYVILGYYSDASKVSSGKITDQRYDYDYLKSQFEQLSNWQSDALHWNMSQVNKIGDLMKKAIEAYERISKKLNVDLHDLKSALTKANEIYKSATNFQQYSRSQSKKAQQREVLTIQPKEKISGEKASIDIENYLGGLYHLTIDEVYVNLEKGAACIIEAKNSKTESLPKEEDIKDGLLKMIIFTNLAELYYVHNNSYIKINEIKPFLKLTGKSTSFEPKHVQILESLMKEAEDNGFQVLVNEKIAKKQVNSTSYLDFTC